MAHVSDEKKQTVQEFVKLLDTYPVVGVVNMQNLPTRQLQTMRSKLRGKKTVLRMTKKRLAKLAFKGAKHSDKLAKLGDHLEGMPALVFTDENPFKLYAELQKTKSKAPAKPGQKAPKDIVVPAGPTSFSPGPVIGQLGKLGIKTGIEAGKIVIKSDSTVARKGDTISAELAGVLQRLGIEPMEIGLVLTAVYENGTVFMPDVLYVDAAAYSAKFATAFNESLNLAVYAAYPASDAVSPILGKAFRGAKAVALAAGYLSPDTAADVLAKAYREMLSVSSRLPDEALSEELKGSKVAAPAAAADAPKHQEKKEEKKEEDAAAGLGSLFG